MTIPALLASAIAYSPADATLGDVLTAFPSSPPAQDHQAAVDALAELVGIEPSYYDVMGTQHVASTAAKVAVLQALSLEADTVALAQQSYATVQAMRASRTLPPVVVLRRQSPTQQEWLLPLLGPAAFSWEITTEDGAHLQGSADARPQGAGWCLPVAAPLADGYHTLSVQQGDAAPEETRLIIAPAHCWLPDGANPEHPPRLWGIGAQLYALRSARNCGMGDLGDLKTLCEITGTAGGDVVGLNPIHALFLPKPEDASPYSPNSRLFLNPLYIALDAVPEYTTSKAAQAVLKKAEHTKALAEAQAAEFVAYTAVSSVKMAVLKALFADFSTLPASHPRQVSYAAFVHAGGERLRLFAIFQALQDAHENMPWPQWPTDYHSPASPAVADFADKNAQEVGFHLWLQFETDRQLGEAAQALRTAGGSLGLYRDLAVGASPDGADVWMDPQAYVRGARFGAPPDALGPLGQDWGLPPFNPQALQQMGYGPFIEMVRANMRHAGALRIDHAMALQHLFWIPPGMTAVDGLYVSYPLDDLLGILALESHRARCMVIGEDLGTVPSGFREKMAEEQILSYRLFYFERYESGLFKRPDAYPPLALATPTSHDLATILGHWRGWDIALRHDLNLCGDTPDRQADEAQRQKDREFLQAALLDQQAIEQGFSAQTLPSPEQEAHLIAAFHRFLSRSPSLLMLANLDDLCGEITQVNVPGTVCEYPNWRRRLTVSLDDLAKTAIFCQTIQAITAERPSQAEQA